MEKEDENSCGIEINAYDKDGKEISVEEFWMSILGIESRDGGG